MKQSIITIEEGTSLSSSKCYFCTRKTELYFSIIDSTSSLITNNNKTGYIMNTIPLCETHADAINKLLSGEINIDKFIKQYESRGKNLNLRAL